MQRKRLLYNIQFESMARDWTRIQTLLIIALLFTLTCLVSAFTNINILCPAIALTVLYFYIIMNHYSNQVGASQVSFFKKDKNDLQKLLISLCLILFLDLPWITIWVLLPLSWYCYRIKSDRSDYFSKTALPVVLICYVQMQLILLRYQKILTISWCFLVFLLFLPTVFMGIMFYLFGIDYYKGRQPTPFFPNIYLDDDDFQQDYVKKRIREGQFITTVLISINLVYFFFVLQSYIPILLYRFLISFAFLFILIQVLSMIFFKQKIVHYWNLPFFSKTYFKVGWNTVIASNLVQNNPSLPSLQPSECLFCTQQPSIIHQCGRRSTLYLCEHCFERSRLRVCPFCSKKLVNIKMCLSKDFLCFNSSYRSKIKSFLYNEEYLIVTDR